MIFDTLNINTNTSGGQCTGYGNNPFVSIPCFVPFYYQGNYYSECSQGVPGISYIVGTCSRVFNTSDPGDILNCHLIDPDCWSEL